MNIGPSNLYVGDMNKGANENKFNWESLQKNRLLEMEAFNQQLAKEAAFTQEENKIMNSIWEKMSANVEKAAELLPGSQKAVEGAYKEAKNELFKKMQNYSSVQSFMADGGAEHLTGFTQRVLGEEFQTGLSDKLQFQMATEAMKTNPYLKSMRAVDASTGKEVQVDAQEALSGAVTGKYLKLVYQGSYNGKFSLDDIPKPVYTGEDTYWTREALAAEMTGKDVAPQIQEKVLQDYDAMEKSGRQLIRTTSNPAAEMNARANWIDAKTKEKVVNNGGTGGTGGTTPEKTFIQQVVKSKKMNTISEVKAFDKTGKPVNGKVYNLYDISSVKSEGLAAFLLAEREMQGESKGKKGEGKDEKDVTQQQKIKERYALDFNGLVSVGKNNEYNPEVVVNGRKTTMKKIVSENISKLVLVKEALYYGKDGHDGNGNGNAEVIAYTSAENIKRFKESLEKEIGALSANDKILFNNYLDKIVQSGFIVGKIDASLGLGTTTGQDKDVNSN